MRKGMGGWETFNGYGIGDNTVGLRCCCKDIAWPKTESFVPGAWRGFEWLGDLWIFDKDLLFLALLYAITQDLS